MVNDYMTPKQITAARKKIGLTPTEMARALGVDYSTFASWQSGRRKLPAVGVRCIELLLANPRQAKKLANP